MELIILAVVAIVTVLFFGRQFFARSKPVPAKPVVTPKAPAKSASTPADDKLPLNIYFGSQSGTAETFANELAEEAKAYGFRPKVIDLEEYDQDEITADKFAVYMMATFGEGEPTDNAQSFYEWICSNQPDADCFANTTFAVFALGNRQYEQFCAVGKKVDQRLKKFGGKALVECGEGDDDGSMDDDFAEWKQRFWAATCSHFKIGGHLAATEEFVPTVSLAWFDLPTKDSAANEEEESAGSSSGSGLVPNATTEKKEDTPTLGAVPATFQTGLPFVLRHTDPKHKAGIVKVTANYELRKDSSDGSTHHLEFDIKGTRLRYLTADNLGVYPRNDYKQAAQLCRRLGVDTRAVFKLEKKATNRKLPLPSPCNALDAMLYYCDFQSTPRQKHLKILAQYAKNPVEKAQLLAYAEEKKDEFAEDRKTWIEVLEEFPSVQPPFGDFVEFMPKLQPRYYTIASSNKLTPESIHITVSLTVEPKPRGRVHKGVASHYLFGLKPERDSAVVFVRPSSFRLPRKENTPIIMVGPGTGVAPFRAFLQESIALQKPETKGPRPGQMTLFFGCRDPTKDWIYQSEMEEATKERNLNLVCAFSRYHPQPVENDHTKEEKHEEQKKYVQHKIADRAEELYSLIIKQGATFYVCGGTAMGRSVRETITSFAQTYGGLSVEKAHEWMKKLQSDGRYIQELWS